MLFLFASAIGPAVGASGQGQSTPGGLDEASCSRLTSLTIPNVRVESAFIVPAGPLAQGGAGTTVPSRCRVAAVATPTPDSRIGIEVWLPASGWNHKLLGTGNGGFSSALNYRAMADGLTRGYAVAGTDTGHTGESTDFGNGHPEKIIDWSHRAVHVMTEVAKLIVRNAHGTFPSRSYFTGCSTGGQQALSEAQRYPDDYDGIIAGDPGHNRLHLIYGFLWAWQATHASQGQPILPSSKLPALHAAAMRSCDTRDGLKDGLISDPTTCRFDPGTLVCRGAETDACLTTAQVEAVRKVYAGPRHPKTGTQIFPGWARGSELGWRGYITEPREPIRVGVLSHWAFHNPAWDARSFDWDRDVAFVDRALPALSATSPDLSAFKKRGGKLLMYTGLADAVVPPQDTIDYYERAVVANGGMPATKSFFRFFPVPGMGHCGGGTGPNLFDAHTSLEEWVERDIAPDRLMAEERAVDGRVVRTRPLCAWPARARYSGTGGTNDGARFTCVATSGAASSSRRPR